MKDEKIMILKGPERVRRRPAVIFGSEDMAGVQNMLKCLLELWLDAAHQGHIRNIALTAYADGSIGLHDDGPGLWFGEGDSIWKHLFCEITCPPRGVCLPKCKPFETPAPDYAEQDNLYLYATVCASEFMDVHAVREGIAYKLHFEKGENIGGLSRDFSDKPTGTTLRFKPDGEVFTETVLSPRWLAGYTRMLAVLVPGLTAIFREEGENGFAESVWCYPEGIVDFLEENLSQCTATSICTDSMEAEGQDRYNKPRYTAKLRFGLRFTAEPGFVQCFHNHRELSYGGRHLDIIIKGVVDSLRRHVSKSLTKEDVLEQLRLVVITASDYTEWMDFHGDRIGNTVLQDMAADLIQNQVDHFVKENKNLLEAVFCRK